MADQQSNFISKFVPKSHFFTDPATISQTVDQAFGSTLVSELRILPAALIFPGHTTGFTPFGLAWNSCSRRRQPMAKLMWSCGLNIKRFIYRSLNMANRLYILYANRKEQYKIINYIIL
jgi:hypothetical protein